MGWIYITPIQIKVSDIESRDVLMRSLSDIAVIAKQGNHQLIALQSGVGNAVDWYVNRILDHSCVLMLPFQYLGNE
jgi:hypothetical protein